MLGGALADLFGIRGTMITGSLLICIATTLVLFFVKEQFTPAKREPGGSFWSDMGEVLRYKAFAALVVTTMLGMASIAALEPVLIPFLKELLGAGAPNWQAGALFSLPGLAFISVASWWARAGERWGYGATITLGLFMGALMVLPQALAVTHWDFAAFRLSQGVFMASINPGIAAAIAMVMPQALRGRAYGLNQSAFAAGNMIGPLMGGFVGTLLGTRWVFVLSALLLLSGAIWTWRVVTPRVNLIRDQSA
jgi:DHA1 family multidrug resistance protein-like MFS transporter